MKFMRNATHHGGCLVPASTSLRGGELPLTMDLEYTSKAKTRMRTFLTATAFAVLCVRAIGATVGSATEAPGSCNGLGDLRLPDAEITTVESLDSPVEHCKLTGTIGREIGFSVWLPADWNGKFIMGGGGGFVGNIQNQALGLGVLQRGYVTAGTDTGHRNQGIDGSWALNNPERLVNYGHLAVHRVTAVSKHIAERHYGATPQRSYFAGCSNGGRQALMSAQRYPGDFDVVLAGAPAHDFAGVAAAFLDVTRHMYPSMDDLSAPILSAEDRQTLASAVLARCDAEDGLEDGILNDPRDCDFDPGSLDLAPEKIAAIRAVYDGPTAPDGRIHVGWPFGGEDAPGGWGGWLAGSGQQAPNFPPSLAFGFGVEVMRHMVEHDPDWRYEGFDFSGFRHRFRTAAAALSATDPNLDAFRENGGKLLIYHGWSDAALSVHASIEYVDAVYARDESARDDVRLFLMPGVLHCAGGPGPWMVDLIEAAEQWDETGTAPDELVAGFAEGGGARPLCAYPQRAVYVGGDDRDPASFACR